MVRENQLRESGSWPETGGRRRNGDSSGYVCHQREFEDLGHGCYGPPIAAAHRSLSRSDLKSGLSFSFLFSLSFKINDCVWVSSL